MAQKRILNLSVMPDHLEQWLNDQASKGYRLARTSNLFYIFEDCEPSRYMYHVEFAADYTSKELKAYRESLTGAGIRTLTKNINFGKFAIGNVRYRPYGRRGASFASSPGNMNAELLIMEKYNDGLPFKVNTDRQVQIMYYQKIRSAFAVVAILLLLTALFGRPNLPRSWEGVNVMEAALKAVLVLICIPFASAAVRYSRKIGALKREK
ncbi:DUF2812 domain-containing protein [Paenibacillus durus]|uniref:DUF2812 domain-containing protein n=1 Tax=Paenibacillus durus TaxID=44251 RepID=UPI000693C7D4|nr:DUF2812 domain-containing protein [Paenibacillus durus]